MQIDRARSGIGALGAIAIACFICASTTMSAQRNATRMEDHGGDDAITWWVVGAGGVLGSGGNGGQLLSATVGQTAIDKVEHRSGDGRIDAALTTYLGYWLPGSGSRTASTVSETNLFSENAMTTDNHPNPFRTLTTINYRLPESGRVRLRIYDLSGMQVRQLLDGDQQAGEHHVIWDALDDAGGLLSSGTYVYKIELIGTMSGSEGGASMARGIMRLAK